MCCVGVVCAWCVVGGGWCVVGGGWCVVHGVCAEKTSRAEVHHASVCKFKTPSCVPAKRPHVETHAGVLPVHTEAVLNVHTEAC